MALVYSTESGRLKAANISDSVLAGDGTVRIHRETKGRKGKGVSLVKGLQVDALELKKIAKKLKQSTGSGGTIKEGVIEVQTDDRDKLRAELEKMGHTVKLAGS